MLTKKERAAIAERIKSVGYVDEKTFYESIVGKCVPSVTRQANRSVKRQR